uniref:Uncharacterized protein n=1 Tax=Micromonas pusilla TaxID=38833 RepID=A0A7S0NJ11_MICPS
MGSRAGRGRGDGSLGLSEPLLTRSTTDRGVASGPLHASRPPPHVTVGAHSHVPSQHSLPLGTAPRDVRAVARRGFRPLRGAWLVLLTWAGTCVATLWALLTDERGLIGPFDDAHAARASLNAALLLASGALELTLRHVLKRRQRQGYLAFYRGVRKLIPQPFRIVALGTAVLFVIVTTGWSVEAARAVATLQCAGMVGCLLAIGERIRRHNAAAPSPDARVALGRGCEDADVLSNAHGWDGSNRGDDVEDGFVGDEASVSEEQAEFNRYLCEQVRELGRECVRLQRRLAEGDPNAEGLIRALGSNQAGDARDDSDGSSGDDDDGYDDDQTFGGGSARPVARGSAPAELTRARSELVRCRAELDERGAEMARLHAACRQHESEQARLRASMDEWSAHAARLERRLERAERGSAGGGQPGGRDEGHRNVS